MFQTKFHKEIFKEIWKKNKTENKDFNLYFFMEFYNRWHKEDLFASGVKTNKEHVFSGYKLSKDNPIFIKKRYKRDVLLALKEFESVLKYLNNNDLINIYDRPKPSADQLPECIPMYLVDETKGDDGIEPFNDAYKIIHNYLGKNYQVREGFRKFRAYWYYTDEELLRILTGVIAPIIAALLTAIVGLMISEHK